MWRTISVRSPFPPQVSRYPGTHCPLSATPALRRLLLCAVCGMYCCAAPFGASALCSAAQLNSATARSSPLCCCSPAAVLRLLSCCTCCTCCSCVLSRFSFLESRWKLSSSSGALSAAASSWRLRRCRHPADLCSAPPPTYSFDDRAHQPAPLLLPCARHTLPSPFPE